MDQDTLAFKLKEFYVLETYQLNLYKSQLPSLNDQYLANAYERIVELEQRHIDYFAEKLLEHHLEKPQIMHDAFSLAGFVSAKSLDLLSMEERCKLAIAVESKAMEMYKEFIETAPDDEKLVKMLWHNRTDEEFHRYWFTANLEKLEKQ